MREEVDSSFHVQSEREILRKQQERKDGHFRRVIEQMHSIDGDVIKVWIYVDDIQFNTVLTRFTRTLDNSNFYYVEPKFYSP